jgi:hypothetical protein
MEAPFFIVNDQGEIGLAIDLRKYDPDMPVDELGRRFRQASEELKAMTPEQRAAAAETREAV